MFLGKDALYFCQGIICVIAQNKVDFFSELAYYLFLKLLVYFMRAKQIQFAN